jgi:ABC-type sugar transport system substrate-binding protein
MFKNIKNLFILTIFVILILLCSINSLAAEKKLVIGFSSPALNEFYKRFEDFAKIGAEKLGVELIVLNADDKEEKQLRDIEDLIAKGVDGIIVAPVTGAVARTIFKKCEDAKIPVVDADRNPGVEPQTEFKQYLAFVGPDNLDAGYRIAKYLIQNMSAGPDGVKSIVGIGGKPGVTNAELRSQGLLKAVAEFPEVKLLASQLSGGFDRENGMALMEDFLVAYDNIDAVWCVNDATALGAIAAIKNAGRLNEMLVGGMDLDRDACESVALGELDYTSGGHWLTGGFALVMLYDYLHGIPIKESERFAQVKLMEVTNPEMAKEVIKKFHDKAVDYDWLKMSRFHNPSAPAAYFEISLENVK